MARTKGAVAVRESRAMLEDWMVIEACANLRRFATPYAVHKWIAKHYDVPGMDVRAVSDRLWAMSGGPIEWTWTTQGAKTNNWYRIAPDYIPAEPFPDPYSAEQRTAMLEIARREAERAELERERRKADKKAYDRRRYVESRRYARHMANSRKARTMRTYGLDEVLPAIRADYARVYVIDTETTGLRVQDDVIELAVLSADGRTIVNRRFGSTAESWDEAENIHHISPEDVAGLPTLEECADEISAQLADAAVIIGYNVGFDISMLHAAGVVLPDVPAWDVMEDYAEYNGEWAAWTEDDGTGEVGSWKWCRLSDAARRCGSASQVRAHSAAGDCILTIDVANHLLRLPPEERHRDPPADRVDRYLRSRRDW